mmetsp:Transcript_6236/g.9724  ORF Transcript_6236/g.9724 Transcript_6236/m.9724 type:complete len:215 (+) Transcript_6236:75-719(+)|eukprot:CAMPEP_0201713820 /NCGR_PEP_ID=MMETSP0593-20130828/525_1 /ASSEMBLY_ACC=CAM_ASM_000672 /TAXON_ID=267983 /ORGANISM="Skeletonema japonicum, Strain CCMP2506" /LENGTH=214 /DNA_ID=CAMNT_0048203015 /DNA_START=33 /DNA_END=677 /DNA_ORIENTATION=+
MTTIRSNNPRSNNPIISAIIILISLCKIALTITHQSTNLRQENSHVSSRRTIMSLSQQNSDSRKNTMVGGYSNLAHDEQVVKIANFALNEHAAKSSSSNVSGSDELSLSVSQEQVDSGEVTAVVLEAQRQVVAGLNYKLTIALMKDSVCLGALKVTVYDRFGDLSVTKWGDRVSCDDVQVQELLHDVQVEEQESKALEVEGKMEEGIEEFEPNE